MNAPSEPLDAESVLRDDALLDALGRGELPADASADPLACALLAWRADVDADIPDGLSDQPRGGHQSASHLRTGRRMAVVAAVAMVVAGTLGSVAAASVAQPGSPLWPLTKVVYSDRAQSLEAREDALLSLRRARAAAADSRPDRARALIAEARRKAGRVRGARDRAKITTAAEALAEQLATGAPPKQLGQRTPPSPAPSPTRTVPLPGPPAPSRSPEIVAELTPRVPLPTAPPRGAGDHEQQ